MFLGAKIKNLRGNMTQAELSRRAGIDKAILSKIESGKMAGSHDCHKKLAAALHLKLSEFYAYLEADEPQEAEVHPGTLHSDTYKDFLEILTEIPLSKKMLPTVITLRPRDEKYLEESVKNVERFIIILKGSIEVGINGSTYRLRKQKDAEKGDSLYSKSNHRLRLKNNGRNTACVLCVSSPPVL
ncbi:MAG: XRE family transcriptional regulator [Candidatus Omnitrophica bacterium]|nr:XRE family transcriptional regulator [Candidatus Omnitrophota bacterium]